MPANFPELWLSRVDNKLKTGDVAPWLDGIEEINADVSVINGGAMNELNQIHIPSTDFDVDILINNNVYPIPVQNYVDGTITLTLDKYQTKQIPLSDDQTIGASYSKIDNTTGLMIQGIQISKYSKAIYSIAPAGNTANTPVLVTTGRTGEFDKDGNEIILKDSGRLCLTYADLVAHKKQYDDAKVPMMNRRLVLCSDHWNDLLLDRRRFGDLLGNMKTGEVAPVIAGFSTYQYLLNPVYNGTNKLAYQAVPDVGQYEASVSFYAPNIGKKTGMTRQYFKPSVIDTETQSNTLAYRHYFMASPKRAMYIGAIISGAAPAPGA